ncbi:MAG: VCBS repeat-containing protein [Thermoplasmatota archaeon]
MKAKAIALIVAFIFVLSGLMLGLPATVHDGGVAPEQDNEDTADTAPATANDAFGVQWEKNYGPWHQWSARYEGPQPVGDADNDGLNELLIGGRDPFMRVMKYDEASGTYYEQQKIVDPVFGIGYGVWLELFGDYHRISQPFGSSTGFSIADITNDGENEVGVAWGNHFSAFKWNGRRYQLVGRYIVVDENEGQGGTTLDCVVGDYDNDGDNEVIVTGGYRNVPEVIALGWNGEEFVEETTWSDPHGGSVFFPWIADVDDDGDNEVIIGPGDRGVVLDWNGDGFAATEIAEFDHRVFGLVSKDSDYDGKPEIHITFRHPELQIWEWNGTGYEKKWGKVWQQEMDTIEAIDIGDVDDDGTAEVCVGTDLVHILEWNGETYEEEYLIDETYGMLAVTCVGDFDNDGMIEINAGAVGNVGDDGYMSWIFKYGL